MRNLTGLASVVMAALAASGMAAQTRVVPDSLLTVLNSSIQTGPVSPTQPLFITVSLQPAHGAELQNFCNQVSDPSSPLYRHFLSPQQVGDMFGASTADVDAVVNYLRSQGMEITLICPNKMSISARTTVAQASKAFGTTFAQFTGPDEWTGKPRRFYANTSPATIPANLTSVINVEGLQSYTHPIMKSTTLTPTLVRGLYNTAPSYADNFRGQGVKIGISNWDAWKLSNAAVYISAFGLPVPAGGSTSNIHDVIVGAGGQGLSGGTEGELDVQMELAVAPLAEIYVFDNGGQGSNLLGVLSAEISTNPDIISESYGWNISGTTLTSAHNDHLSMTAAGITYMAASGDSGASGVNGTFAYPGYDPEVLEVGGTVATVNTTTGVRISEVGWNGSGGGWSNNAAAFNIRPTWQGATLTGPGVPPGSINHHLQPDIAEQAAATNGAFYTYINSGQLTAFDGTSCASPSAAGSLGTVEQRMAAVGLANRFGRIADLIYSMNGRSDVFFDITSGNNGTLPNGSASNATTGWDTVTGWGAPNWEGFYNAVGTITIAPSSFTIVRGVLNSGSAASLASQDGSYLVIGPSVFSSAGLPPVDVIVSKTTTAQRPAKLNFHTVAHVSAAGITQTLELFNNTTNTWDVVDSRAATTSDQTVDVNLTSTAAQYVGSSGSVQGRLVFSRTGAFASSNVVVSIDQAVWTLN